MGVEQFHSRRHARVACNGVPVYYFSKFDSHLPDGNNPGSRNLGLGQASLLQTRLPILHDRELLLPALPNRHHDEKALSVARGGRNGDDGCGQLKSILPGKDWKTGLVLISADMNVLRSPDT
jgi:hypothetical protein